MRNAITVLLLLLSAAPAVIAQQATRQEPPRCPEIQIGAGEGEVWTFSGSFPSPTQLTLVDALNDRLLRFDASKGRYLGGNPDVIEKVINRAFGEFTPSAIATNYRDQTTWLQIVGGRFLEIREGNILASTAKPTQLWGMQLEEDARLVAVLRWALMGDTLLGYGNFRMSDGELETGFYAVRLRETSDAQVIASYPETHEAMTWYRLGYPYVATVGDAGYVLNVDGTMSIGKIARSSSSARYTLALFSALPEALTSSPPLPRFTTPEDYVGLMEKVENLSIPAGLYGWKDHLYLLWRTRKEDQQEWWLSKIDPENGTYLGQARLPSSANHLMVVPGPLYWALVSKGPIRGFGLQSVEKVTLIPAPIIESLPNKGILCQ